MRGIFAFWSSVIAIVMIAALAYVVHKIRRTAEEQRRRSEDRAAALMLALQKGAREPATTEQSNANLSTPKSPSAPPIVPAAPDGLRRRARILTDTQRLLYLVLRSGLPDYPLMAHVRIVDLLDRATNDGSVEREPRLRDLLHQRLDFVVCNSDLVPVAALVVYESGIANVPDESAKVEALRELGIRFLRFRADSLPRPAEIRGLVLG